MEINPPQPEQPPDHPAIDEVIRRRAESINIGDILLAEGQSIVFLDGEGNLVERHPEPPAAPMTDCS